MRPHPGRQERRTVLPMRHGSAMRSERNLTPVAARGRPSHERQRGCDSVAARPRRGPSAGLLRPAREAEVASETVTERATGEGAADGAY
eukprot:3801301-Prymnesium_polylepis.1